MGKRENGCPRHGTEYIHSDGHGAIYCIAPTPGELSSRCFYHPVKTQKGGFKEPPEDTDRKPDVIKAVFSEYEHHKELKEKRRVKSKEYYVQARIRSSEKRKKFIGNYGEGLSAHSGLYLE